MSADVSDQTALRIVNVRHSSFGCLISIRRINDELISTPYHSLGFQQSHRFNRARSLAIVRPLRPKAFCFGATCRGKDPQVFGCATDARTLASKRNAEIKVELRYSRKCNARWSRVTAINPSRNLLSAWLGAGMVDYATSKATKSGA